MVFLAVTPLIYDQSSIAISIITEDKYLPVLSVLIIRVFPMLYRKQTVHIPSVWYTTTDHNVLAAITFANFLALSQNGIIDIVQSILRFIWN